MKILLTFSFLFFSKTTLPITSADDILGLWISKNKDLKVEIFKQNNKYFGKIIWFYCPPKSPKMASYLDVENPNKSLKNQPWLGMINVSNLEFNETYWQNGSIYDPNSGRTYSAIVKKKSNNSLIVRGYWGFEFIGKSLEFTKL